MQQWPCSIGGGGGNYVILAMSLISFILIVKWGKELGLDLGTNTVA